MNFTISVILVAIAVIAILVGVISSISGRNKELSRENRELLEKINLLNINVAYLVKHSQELASIQRSHTEIRNKIEEAKDDEEISDIVSTIIAANNSRVQNNKTE